MLDTKTWNRWHKEIALIRARQKQHFQWPNLSFEFKTTGEILSNFNPQLDDLHFRILRLVTIKVPRFMIIIIC